MFSFRMIAGAVAVLAASSFYAHAETRVALVIGNSAYKNVSRLQNPANDAAASWACLRRQALTPSTRAWT